MNWSPRRDAGRYSSPPDPSTTRQTAGLGSASDPARIGRPYPGRNDTIRTPGQTHRRTYALRFDARAGAISNIGFRLDLDDALALLAATDELRTPELLPKDPTHRPSPVLDPYIHRLSRTPRVDVGSEHFCA